MGAAEEIPKLARRKENRRSTIKSGRTIGEKREKLETASERASAHKKIKRQQTVRIALVVASFVIVGVGLFYLGTFFLGDKTESPTHTSVVIPYSPTIPIEDQDAGQDGAHITSRMKEFIGQLESDLRELGYRPIKAVIPTGAIREVDFYLDGVPGFLKTTIDRGTGVTAEDADRVIRYLKGEGITSYEYIDIRIEGRAYWK